MMFSNEFVPMTRRYPDLPNKVLRRDSKIVQRLIDMWDVDHDEQALFDYFLKERANLSDYRYWELLRTVWILCGKVERLEQFKTMFKSIRPKQYYFSTPEEAKRLRELKFPVEVYRATNDPNDGGFSWTLDKAYAEKYKTMFNKSEIISRSVNSKDEIFAFIERNKEEEVLIVK